MQSTINHANAQKDVMHLIAHSKRRPRNGTSVQFAGCITRCVIIAILNWNRSHKATVTYYFGACYTNWFLGSWLCAK